MYIGQKVAHIQIEKINLQQVSASSAELPEARHLLPEISNHPTPIEHIVPIRACTESHHHLQHLQETGCNAKVARATGG